MTAPPETGPSVPSLGASTTERVSASPSGSVQVSGMLTGVPARAASEMSSHAGGREIVTCTVAGAESAVPSVARYVNESAPNWPAAGV